MKWTVVVGLLLLSSNLGRAQEDTPESKSPGQARFESLDKAWTEQAAIWWNEQQEAIARAEASGGDIPAMPMKIPLGDFLEEFEKAADAFKGSDDAVPFLMWIVEHTMADKSELKHLEAALATLMSQHVQSERLVRLPDNLRYLGYFIGEEKAALYLKTLEAQNPNRDIRAHCILIRVGGLPEKDPPSSKAYRKARAELLRAKDLAESKGLKALIQGKIDSREKLSTWQRAPDIEGVDLDGVAFKLSDYRGKIIMLDFWGDW